MEIINTSPADQARYVLQLFKSESDSYKKEALDLALKLRPELTQALLKILSFAADHPQEFLESDDDSLSYAAVLLSYWEEELAFSSFVKFTHLDEGLLDELWGDMVTQDFQIFLYRTGKNKIEDLKKLARDSKSYVYIRSAALNALNWCVVENELLYNEIQQFYLELFTNHKNQKDPDLMGNILANWLDLHPINFLDVIATAFARNRVDEMIAGDIDEIRDELKNEGWADSKARLKAQMLKFMPEDIHGHTSWWSENFEDDEYQPDPLELLMTELGVKMRFHELRAYTLGAMMGLELLPPSYLIAKILLVGTAHETKFETKAVAEHFCGLFMDFWNKFASLNPTDLTPILVPIDVDLSKMDPIFSKILLFRRKDEARCFLSVLHEADTNANTIIDSKAKEAFNWIENYSARLEGLCEKISSEDANATKANCAEIQFILAEADSLWPGHYQKLDEGLRYQRILKLGTEKIMTPKVGRNDP